MEIDPDSATTADQSARKQKSAAKPVERIGPYRLGLELGAGGMGSVYLAHRDDEELQMSVAIKLIRDEVTTDDMIARFRTERQMLADLKHPHIATLYDGGTTDFGQPYIIMEYVDGLDIATWCRQFKPTLPQLIDLFTKVVDAVGYAHHNGVIHRDIKPANLMVNREGQPKLLDFGIAMLGGQMQTDLAMTPMYAAPEQREYFKADERTDLYALCLLFLELLNGERPSEKHHPQERITQLEEHGRPKQMITAEREVVPEALGHVLRCGLAENRDDRYVSTQQLLADLKRLRRSLWPDDFDITKVDFFRYDLLLWHHSDDLEAVRALAAKLETEGMSVWPKFNEDETSVVKLPNLTQALEASRACAICLGPQATAPGWRGPFNQAAGMRDHLAFRVAYGDFQILPVLLPGTNFPSKQTDLPVFLRDHAWLSLPGMDGDGERLRQALLNKEREAPDSEPDATMQETGICPFRGLEVFREQDYELFFGREALCQRIRALLLESNFISVLGPSGSGKSSVVRAGILPQLREQGNPIVMMNPGANPINELAHGLSKLSDFSPSASIARLCSSSEALHFMVRDIMAKHNTKSDAIRKRLYLVIDQFEEVFTLTDDRSIREIFIDNLCHAVDQTEGRLCVIINMRSDFLGHCAHYPNLNKFVLDHSLQVEPMSRKELASTIMEPARMGGLVLERGLMERILNDVEHADVELPLLEHALLELYERRENGRLTLAAYADIGGIEGALAKRAESEYAALNEPQRDMLRKMFTLCLVHPGEGAQDTRRRATRSELLAVGDSPEIAETIMARWTERRLLTGDSDDSLGTETVDIAHEALIRKWDRIGEWMAEDREMARLLGHLRRDALTWEAVGRDEDHLLRGGPLHQMQRLVARERGHLGTLELAFVEAGSALERKEKRRARRNLRLLIALAFGGIAMALIASFFYQQSKQSEEQALISEQKALDEKALAEQAVLETNYNLSFAFNKDAGLSLDEGKSEQAWLQTLAAMSRPVPEGKNLAEPRGRFFAPSLNGAFPLLWVSPVVSKLTALALSPDGKVLAMAGDDTFIRLMSPQTGEQLGFLSEAEMGLVDLTFSNDGTRLAAASENKDIYLWALPDGGFSKLSDVHESDVSAVAFSPDGRVLASAGTDGGVALHSLDQSEPQLIHRQQFEKPVQDLAFNQAGSQLWIAVDQSLWELSLDGSFTLTHVGDYGSAITVLCMDAVGRLVRGHEDGKVMLHLDNGAVKTIVNHGLPILSLAVTPDYNGIFSADQKGTLIYREGRISRQRTQLQDVPVTSLVGAPDRVYGIGPNQDFFGLRISDMTEMVHSAGHSQRIWDIDFSPDGALLASSSEDGKIILWDAFSGEPLHQMKGHSADVWSVAFSPDGTRLASGSADETIRLWTRDGKPLRVFEGHTGTVAEVAFSPDGTQLISASHDQTLRLWSMEGETIKVLRGHTGPVWRVAISPDGKYIASGGSDQRVRLWSADGTLKTVMEGHRGIVMEVAFSPDGKHIASAARDQTVRLWSLAGEALKVMRDHNDRVYDLVFSPDGRQIISAGVEDELRVWSSNGELIDELLVSLGSIYDLAFSPDGKRLATSSGDRAVRIWDFAKRPVSKLQGEAAFYGLAFSPNGDQLASGSVNNSIYTWDKKGQRQTLEGHSGAVYRVAFHPNGSRLASVSADGTLRFWSSEGESLATISGSTKSIYALAYAPDGERVASGSGDAEVYLWTPDGQLSHKLVGHSDNVLGLAFSPDGNLLASASRDDTVRLWSSDGAFLKVLEGHSNDVYDVAFSADSLRLATASLDLSVRLWTVEGEPLQILRGHSGSVLGVAFSPDGKWLASSSEDGTTRIWDAISGSPVAVLRGHEEEVNWSLAFSPDSRLLATPSNDKTIRLWQMDGLIEPPSDAVPHEWYGELLHRSLRYFNYRQDGFQLLPQNYMRLVGPDMENPSQAHLYKPRPAEVKLADWLMKGNAH